MAATGQWLQAAAARLLGDRAGTTVATTPSMKIVGIASDQAPADRMSGSGMDRSVARRGLPRSLRLAIAAGVLVALGIVAWWLAPSGTRQTVDASRVTISEVRNGVFEDFLPLRARVTPLVTVFLDAVEGGRVENVLVEDGATVAKGQLLAILSNAELQLSTLARETEVAEQLNNLRTIELALSRTQLENERAIIQADLDASKARRLYDMQRPLAERGFVAGKAIRDSEDDLRYQQERGRVLRRAQATDQRLQTSQLGQLRATAASLQSALAIARGNLDQLKLRAPVAGQLTAFSIQVGQSLDRGERVGQIDSAGRTKLVAGVDEFYLGRVEPGQIATLEHQGRAYRLKVGKIYPQVKNGEFVVDLLFTAREPEGIQRGQTLQAKLTLSDPAPARLIPAGAFHNDTGGNWVFVVTPDGSRAERRAVRLGRRNAEFIEVLDGLDPGEKLITSPYTGLLDKSGLDLERQ